MAKVSYAEGVIQHSPGSRTERAHPGWTENINSNPDRVAQLSIHRNTVGIQLWNPFRVRPIATNASPGWRGFAADPGLRCPTPAGYSIRGNQSFLAKLGTTEPASRFPRGTARSASSLSGETIGRIMTPTAKLALAALNTSTLNAYAHALDGMQSEARDEIGGLLDVRTA